MTKDQIPVSGETMETLARQYATAVNLLSQTYMRRNASARFYISLASVLVGLLTLVYREGVDTGDQVWTVNILFFISAGLNLAWFLTIRAQRYLGSVQRSLLVEMEKLLPFDFVTRQVDIIDKSHPWTNTGLIEQYLPIGMMIPSAVIFVLINII